MCCNYVTVCISLLCMTNKLYPTGQNKLMILILWQSVAMNFGQCAYTISCIPHALFEIQVKSTLTPCTCTSVHNVYLVL